MKKYILKKIYSKIISAFIVSILLTGCGRKQKNIFHFPSDKPVSKINKLSLPAINGLKVKRTQQGNVLSWQAVRAPKEIQVSEKEKVEVDFVGYNVYRLVNALFVPKKTVNEFLIKESKFLDTKILEKNIIEQRHCYIIRAVFKINDTIIQGPSSQVVFEK